MKKHERFWGLHFDFHADNRHTIGNRTDSAEIEAYIKAAKPEFIQCDTKGHPGWSSYPTGVGNAASDIQGDGLRIWCETAHKHGIPIYAHYSSLIDGVYGEAHPEEVVRDESGEPIKTAGSLIIGFQGNYVDGFMLPQLCELIRDYGMDGVWLDGDCWAVRRDYSERALAGLPKNLSNEEYADLMRERYTRYLNHVVESLHRCSPEFHVMSNWAYSSYMPEKPKVNLDSLSGDLARDNSAHSARYEGRCLAAQEMPWDLMSWGFVGYSPGITVMEEKPTEQLCQEAAQVLSLGGGFQVYIAQDLSGAATKESTLRIAQTAEFVRSRRQNYKRKPFAQTAVFLSATARYRASEKVYSPGGSATAFVGILNAVIESGYTADVLLEYQIEKLSQYDIVAVPEWVSMGAGIERALLQYAENGGHLVLIGADTCVQFGGYCGLSLSVTADPIDRWISDPVSGCFCRIRSRFADLDCGEEKLYRWNDLRDADTAAYRTIAHGKGSITFLPFDLGTYYMQRKSFLLTGLLGRVYRSIVCPVVERMNGNIDITMQKTEHGRIVNLINMNQNRNDQKYNVFDEVPPIPDVEIVLHFPCKAVRALYGETLEWHREKDGIHIHLPKLLIHTAIETVEDCPAQP